MLRRPIQVLPPAVSERIAAGEVIENPAAVVRELIENSLDAGAREISVDVTRGGLDTIRIADDGCGIPSGDLELAVARHATSKIASADDLAEIQSLGFRGEALASIAAVAELTLLSRTPEEESGARVRVRDGTVTERGPAARSPGTTAVVQGLFAAVPARRKFLREPAVETAAIAQMVRRLALARPGIRFQLRSDGRPLVQTSGAGRRQAVAEIFGQAIAAGLVEIPARSAGAYRISGFVGNRSLTRPNRLAQWVVVNGRPSLPSSFVQGLEATYRGLLPRGRHPLIALWIEAPAGEVDANVHPSKREVRLRHERELLIAVTEEVRRLLGREPALAPLEGDFLFVGRPASHQRLAVAEDRPGWPAGETDATGSPDRLGDPDRLGGGSLPRLRLIGQAQDSLIVAESAAGLLLIDQHRAHETILWTELRSTHPRSGADLAEPLLLHLPGGDPAQYQAALEDLTPLGFELEQFGPHAFLIRRVPTSIAEAGLPAVLFDPTELLPDRGDWRDRLVAGLACRTALPKGRPLSLDDQVALIHRLDALSEPAVCPHGSPVILRLSEAFLDRQFRWR